MKFNPRNVIEIGIIVLVFTIGITSGILVLQSNLLNVVPFIVDNNGQFNFLISSSYLNPTWNCGVI